MPPVTKRLVTKLRRAGVRIPKTSRRSTPLWEGPCGEGENGGVTQSLLNGWMSCRERTRLKLIEGLCPEDTFNHHLEYGQMWHTCEEALAVTQNGMEGLEQLSGWARKLKEYCQGLCRRYPLQQEQIEHWMNVCKVQFPVYVDYWRKHPDVKDRTPLLQEQTFNVPYPLPSGRIVRLRGKFDSVDLIGKGKSAAIYLQENKTKSDIDEMKIRRQLTFDMQTMIYLIALESDPWLEASGRLKKDVKGVRYNVVRRPLSGGKGSIRQLKPTKSNPQGETSEAFYQRLVNDYIIPEPEYWFMRWKSEVTPGDLEKFKHEFLTPVLEELCDWYEWVSYCHSSDVNPFIGNHNTNKLHWRRPFGVYSILEEGGSSDLDEFLTSGSEVGLRRIDHLFGELR